VEPNVPVLNCGEYTHRRAEDKLWHFHKKNGRKVGPCLKSEEERLSDKGKEVKSSKSAQKRRKENWRLVWLGGEDDLAKANGVNKVARRRRASLKGKIGKGSHGSDCNCPACYCQEQTQKVWREHYEGSKVA
jgi:hypothetical protein